MLSCYPFRLSKITLARLFLAWSILRMHGIITIQTIANPWSKSHIRTTKQFGDTNTA